VGHSINLEHSLMEIDTEHLHYWMQAIRQSPDPLRTMDAFWQGQLKSKEWLINELSLALQQHTFISSPVSIEIHGGWVGVLASMIFQSEIPTRYICSVDIDPSCKPIATMMNKIEEMDGRFKAVTGDMCLIPVVSDIVINTSCEHITQDQYDIWLNKLSNSTILVLQSNNYNIPEHIRTAVDVEEFKKQCGLKNILYSGELYLPMYNRFMIIGTKQ